MAGSKEADECIFCKFAKDPSVQFYSNEYFFARYDQNPISPGHALIIPKKHIVSIFDLTEKEWSVLKSTIDEAKKRIESADLKEVYEGIIRNPSNERCIEFCREILARSFFGKKPDGYNVGNNDGEAAGRTVNHLHIHIIPRYFGDVEDPRGGIRHIIPQYANYK